MPGGTQPASCRSNPRHYIIAAAMYMSEWNLILLLPAFVTLLREFSNYYIKHLIYRRKLRAVSNLMGGVYALYENIYCPILRFDIEL